MKIRAALLMFLALAPGAFAQIPGLGGSKAEPPKEAAADAMGRSTPRGSIVGFSRAVGRNDFMAAARYLQLDGLQDRDAASLATVLGKVIDRDLHESINSISDKPSGALDDGLAEDRERIGPLEIGGRKAYIELIRVRDGEDGLIWLVSSDTLRLIPALAKAGSQSEIERVMPTPLLEHEFLGLSAAHWAVLLGLLFGAFALLWLIGILFHYIASSIIRDGEQRRAWDAWYDATRWPAIGALTIVIQFMTIPSLGFPLTFRVAYGRAGLVAFVILATWLLRRGLSLAFSHARGLARGKERNSTQSLMLLAERLIQAVIVVIAIVAVLILLGVESKAALAVLGVVGVALALGAQKTVENLLGGIFLISDKALAVGDNCTIGNQSGVIEDVTLRSVRMRTANQSLLSLPAGSLAQVGIENFATRRKMPINSTLRLRYGTSAAQIARILSEVRELLEHNEKLEAGESYIRLTNFGVEAIELELFAFVLTNDPKIFREVREALLLEIAERVEAAGSGLGPMRFMQLHQDPEAVTSATRVPTRESDTRSQ